MFTQKCFIRKNTLELREKLRNLGIRHNSFDDNEGEWLASNYGMFISVFPGFENLHDEDIDCGENEELFLAIAAIRNDSDKNQWFIFDEYIGQEEFPTILLEGLHLCHKDKSSEYFPKYYVYHKATPQELKKYFKEK